MLFSKFPVQCSLYTILLLTNCHRVTMFYAHLLFRYTVNGVQSLPSFMLGTGDAVVTQAGSLFLMCQMSVSCIEWGQGEGRGVCSMLGVPGGGPGELLEDGGPPRY